MAVPPSKSTPGKSASPKTAAHKTAPRKAAPKAAQSTLAKSAPKSSAPIIKVVSDAPAKALSSATPAVLRKKELIERVVATSGAKKKDAKPAIEAVLEVLGKALAAGEDLNLPGLGKVMIKRRKEQPSATVLTCRIRQPKKPAVGTNPPLAKPIEGR